MPKVYLVWYHTKKDAENSAASRALDCRLYSENASNGIPTARRCREEPYDIDSRGASPLLQLKILFMKAKFA